MDEACIISLTGLPRTSRRSVPAGDIKKGDEKMYTACEIAEYIVALADRRGDKIDQLKLQKLLYYVQGAYLGTGNAPLFDDDFLAWKLGPAIFSVWTEYTEHNSDPIKPSGGKLSLNTVDEQKIDAIYEQYRAFTSYALVEKTHKEPPWKNAFSDVITKESIRNYFANEVFSTRKLFDHIPVTKALPSKDYTPGEDGWYDEWKALRENDRRAV
jgi:uncharacterized phage-associated protein